ncbi:MAG: VOC family protein [Micrococcales bacterium]|nr:VOC family protein [Micrococcales bacterium]
MLDATDARGLAEFYRAFLGWGYRPGDQAPADAGDDSDWLVLTDPAGPAVLAVNQVASLAGHPRPTHQSPAQVHHDYAVPTLDELRRQRQRAVALGATLLLDRSDDPDHPLCTLLDPAGHRFCILVDP